MIGWQWHQLDHMQIICTWLLLAKDSEVREKPLQLGRTYRGRTLRKMKTAG